MIALNQDERDQLRWLADWMIPADEIRCLPSAGEPAIFAAILVAIEAQPISLSSVLSQVPCVQGASDVGLACEHLIAETKQQNPAGFNALLSALAHSYYGDDRVMIALGIEPRPPFPKGLDLEPGDWSVLEPVQSRAPIWRN